jgi:acyl transferase domain-containing protein/thioesterase domain-containing protein
MNDSAYTGLEVAVIGLALRVPGAPTDDQFWANLCSGVESITVFSREELLAAGVDPAMLDNPQYVPASAILEQIDRFDAAFFGITPREAGHIDPQHRLFLECAWAALENAGYDPAQYSGVIGVYAGVGSNSYTLYQRPFSGSAEDYQITLGNDKDFLATRVSYKFDLKGPSLTIQTACSTSLVAAHLACQSLLSGECDIALAGGVSIRVPQKTGYLYQEGGVISPDGHCRAFDARAQGTVVGSGAGVVILKRLEDALQAGDQIVAIIKGTAINNDGAAKVGYTAPSVEGQARVIRAAQRAADVEPDTIGYIETHGTGTALGDPLEIAALTQAFRARTQQKHFCAIGSVKTNIGHLDAAAGVVGLIKTALALKHRQIPASLNYEQPNPKIDFADSPFWVNTTLRDWITGDMPRRAGVSSFGMGGTNAHAVLEEAPPPAPVGRSRPWQLLVLSAKTRTALETAATNLIDYLQQHQDLPLADAAYTLQIGRKAFDQRLMLVCRDRDDALAALVSRDPGRVIVGAVAHADRPVVFLFPGQGAQHSGMAAELYQSEPRFRAHVDRCADLLQPHLGFDLRSVLFPDQQQVKGAADQLNQTAITQLALFVIEYALAQLWIDWGCVPQAMLGHSVGEYVAACLAGVFSLEDALSLLAARGRLMQQMASGSMLSVPLGEEAIRWFLAGSQQLSLAAINGPAQSVVSGPTEAIVDLEQRLGEHNVQSRRLQTSHAFHSAMMEPLLESFIGEARKVSLHPPQLPYVSNVTGTWITETEATDPGYWARHLRETVRFADGLRVVLEQPAALLLEVGPGQTLTTLARRHPAKIDQQLVLPSMRRSQDQQSDVACLLQAVGHFWLSGGTLDWARMYADERRQRVPLPTYPFERQSYWLAPQAGSRQMAQSVGGPITHESSAAPLEQQMRQAYTPPRDRLEQTIADLWQQLLGVNPVSIDDHFFELGGDSLVALQLIALLREHCQVELPPHSVIEAPTVAALAERIRQATALAVERHEATTARSSLLVEIQAGGPKQPIFAVHPVGGGVYIYRDLARHVGTAHPVYGIQAQGFDGKAEPLRSIAEMAERYLQLIRALQPAGPYLLVGASFGGVVCFEIAQRLLAQNQSVALLTLIDTPDLRAAQLDLTDEEVILASVAGVGAALSAFLAELRRRAPDEQLRYCFEQAQANKRLPAGMAMPGFRRYIQLLTAHMEAMRHYQPSTYPGHILYFRAAERDPLNLPHPERGWIELAGGGITIYEIPGNHTSINEAPHVELLAEKLSRQLDRIDRELL